MDANRCDSALHRCVFCNRAGCKYIGRFRRQRNIEHFARYAAVCDLRGHGSVQQVGKRRTNCKTAFCTDRNLAGFVARPVIEEHNYFLSGCIVSAGVGVDIVFRPHFSLHTGLQARIGFPQFSKPLDVLVSDSVFREARHDFAIFFVCDTCPLRGNTAAIAVLLSSVVHIGDTADSENKGQCQSELLIVIVGKAQEAITVMIVDKRNEMVYVCIFVILIKNRFNGCKAGIVRKDFTGLEEKREVKHAPFIIGECTHIVDIADEDLAKRGNTDVGFKLLQKIFRHRTCGIDADAISASQGDPVFICILDGLPGIGIILVQIIQTSEVVIQNLIFIVPVCNITIVMIPVRIVEWGSRLIAGRAIGGACTVKIVCRMIRNNVQNYFESFAVGCGNEIDQILLRAEVRISRIVIVREITVITGFFAVSAQKFILRRRRDPDRRYTQIFNVVQLLRDTLPVTALCVFELSGAILLIQRTVICRVCIIETVR